MSIRYKTIKELSEMLKNNRVKELIKAAWDAPVYRPDGIVAAKDLFHLVATEDKVSSVPYPYEFMNDKTKGLRKGELVTITAGSGIGKSAFVREIAHHLLI